MAGSRSIELIMQMATPHTFNAMQKLVMAMAGVANNAGKKSFFGKDKGQESYDKFLNVVRVTVQAMVLDKLIQESSDDEDVVDEIFNQIEKFALAYPNWKDAYGFAVEFFVHQRHNAIAAIGRYR